VADSPTTPPDDRHDLPGEPTLPVEVRKDTLAAVGGTDFRHGRFEPGQRLGSRYRIVARLGEGGMGEVYRADDLELGQSVALKFLPERVVADESWLRRFRNEVRTARQVAHANVCRIYDIAEVDDHVFLSMEYIDGEDLAGVLRRLGRPSLEKAIEIARQICLGLAAAHENNVLHRDLKPANIMIDGRGRVRITDFGLAGFLDELESVEARAGTPAYMAPEQLVHGRVSVRSDIYSLGLILHELFTGTPVFDTDDIEELKRRHSRDSAERPSSSISEEIDPAVDRVIARCLEPRPEDRPQSVYQVLAALPGGDPLAAALAAGETPSPELVANARDAGGLSPRIAIVLVLALVVSVAVMYVLLLGRTVMPRHSPARLTVVAEQIMEGLGYEKLPRYSVSGYDINLALTRSLREKPQTTDQLQNRIWPPKYRYWRRWSNGEFLPTDPHFPEQLMIDAPNDQPESTVTVALDSTGRLLGLAVPPEMTGPATELPDEIDWSPLFDRAQLDPENATQVHPSVAPTVYCDTVIAWQFDRSAEGPDPLTVLTGAFGGHLTYFEYVGLRNDMEPNHASWKEPADLSVFVWMAVTILLVLLAVRNAKAGRADHRNAVKCALFVGGLYAILEIVAITVGGSNPADRIVALTNGRAVGHILQHGIEGWVYYLAIEPYVRRVWPRMLIGLMRVFSGRWRDPAVGREVLIGLEVGCVLALTVKSVEAFDWRLATGNSAHLVNPLSLRTILSPAHFLSNRAHVIAWAVLDGISYAGLVVLIRVLVRHALVSLVFGVAVLTYLSFGWLYDFTSGTYSDLAMFIQAAGFGVCSFWLLTRVGVLSGMVFDFVVLSSGFFGLAFDAWSTPYLLSWLAMLLVLVAYGFWVSLAGQPIFKDMLAEPQPVAR
jgi:hypothetical protein